jgi:predicted nucleotidyltransferase
MMKLKGKNQIRKFRLIAEALKSKITQYEGVVGIIFIGGLVRGFADKYSDVDIIVLLRERDESLRKAIRRVGLDEQKRSGIDIDLEVHIFEDFKKREWNEMLRWDFSRAEIVFDHHGEIRRLVREKMNVPESFWIKRIVIDGEHLKWYCCPTQEGIGSIVDLWIDRGDLVSAHYCLSHAFDLLIRIIFALNREILPAPKWRIFYSFKLKWLPKDYKTLLEEVVTVKTLSTGDLRRRLKALQIMWAETLFRLKEENGLTPQLISKYYVEKVLRQI